MSNLLFPLTLPGLGWPVKRTPEWATTVQVSASGKESRSTLFANPRWHWELIWSYIKDLGSAPTPFDTLMDFYNRHYGSMDSFLFTDPDDNAVTAMPFGTGDGITTNFQLTRAQVAGGFAEAIQHINVLSAVFVNDWQGLHQVFSTPRTNLLPFATALDNAAWTKNQVTITANATTAPDGTLTADKLVESATATVEHYIQESMGSVTDNTIATTSICAKPNSRNWIQVSIVQKDAATVKGMFFNVATGALGTPSSGVTGTITPLPNGWFRCSITVSVGAGGTNPVARYKMTTGDNVSTYTGDGVSNLFMWGSQSELASAMTGFIPTTTTAVTVTDYILNTNGSVTFAVAPLALAALTWTGTYFFRVRFEEDKQEFQKTMNGIYEEITVKLVSVR